MASCCSGLRCSCPCELWHSPGAATWSLGQGWHKQAPGVLPHHVPERERRCSELHGDPAQLLLPDALSCCLTSWLRHLQPLVQVKLNQRLHGLGAAEGRQSSAPGMVWRKGLLLEAAVPSPGREVAKRGLCDAQRDFWGVSCPWGSAQGPRVLVPAPGTALAPRDALGCGSVPRHQVVPPPRPRSPRRPRPDGSVPELRPRVRLLGSARGAPQLLTSAIPDTSQPGGAAAGPARSRGRRQQVPVPIPRPFRASAPLAGVRYPTPGAGAVPGRRSGVSIPGYTSGDSS